jgi:hypothetical protein
MLALVGVGMANSPSPTMLSVITQIVAGEAQQPRRGTARILQQARAADRAVHGHCAVPGINLDSVFMSGMPGIFLASRCLRTPVPSASSRSSTAGAPQAIALSDDSHAAIGRWRRSWSPPAVIVAAVCTPMLTAWVRKRPEALGRRAETTQVNEESHVEFDNRGALSTRSECRRERK